MKFIENIKEEEYENFVQNHPKSHFLQSYEWGMVSKRRGFTPYYVGLEDGNEIKATALLLKKSLPFGYSYFYIPRGFTIDYNDKDLVTVFTKEITKFTKKHKSIFFKIDPDIKLHTINEMALKIDGEDNYALVSFLQRLGYKRRPLTKYFETMQPRYTFRIDLTPPLEEIRKNYSQTARNAIKRAESYGVLIKEGTKEDIDDFVRLMKMTEKRQNFYSHEDNFYYYFYDIFSKKNYVKFLLAELNFPYIVDVINKKIEEVSKQKKVDMDHLNKLKEEQKFFMEKVKTKEKEIVSAYFMVYYGNKSWYLYGANDMEYKNAFANYKLFDYQVAKAKESQIAIFDEFGTIGDPKSTKSVVGIHEFKKKFGGEYTEFIGEFDFVTKPFMYFMFTKLIPLYTKPLKWLRRLKVRMQKGE